MANIIISEEEYNELKKSRDSWRERYYELRYALRKDEQLDESISCVRDIPSDVEIIEDLKKRTADSDYYKGVSELLEEKNKKIGELEVKLKNANEVADSWKRDYERLRDQFVHPMCNILYPDKPDLNINLTDLLNDVKNLKIYAGENKSMYEDLKYWEERCHKAETDVTILNSKVEVLENKLRKVDSIRDAVWNEKELKQKISDLTEANENLTKAVERRDRWVEEFKSDVDTLQNEILRIRNIAQKAYDDTNRD